jgi:queuine tRNA-ribosyltransferase
MFEFISEKEVTEARSGHLVLKHGTLETPCFLPVATKADVKMTTPRELEEMKAQGIIANAFVLYLRPGVDVIEAAGGVHRFMNWDKVVFTDSGGFQMLSSEFLVKVSDEHVTFKSPFDGKKHDITPEICAELQMRLGSDVALALDDCPPYGSEKEYVASSAVRTVAWARRFREMTANIQTSFGIVQGGTFRDLREGCTRKLVEMDFDGYAIGGLCIGEPKELMHEVIGWTTAILPEEKPRYLMGVGSPEDMLEAISRGVDIFDSVFPTRNARHNTVYTRKGRLNLGKEKLNREFGPIDKSCRCYTCTNHSLAYVNHLLREYEYLGMRLATIHNLHFLINLMEETRTAIKEGEFNTFKDDFLGDYLGQN